MEYILIIAMWTADSAALTSISGFVSMKNCEDAGREAKAKFSTLIKKVEYVCVKK